MRKSLYLILIAGMLLALASCIAEVQPYGYDSYPYYYGYPSFQFYYYDHGYPHSNYYYHGHRRH